MKALRLYHLHQKLQTPEQKVQLKINFDWINGKFQCLNFLTLYKTMLFVMETVYGIRSHTLPCYFLSEGYCLGECGLTNRMLTLQINWLVSIWYKFLLKAISEQTIINSYIKWDADPLQQPPCKKPSHYGRVKNQQNITIMKVEIIFFWIFSYSFPLSLLRSSSSSSLMSHSPSSTPLNILSRSLLSSVIPK